MGLRAKFNLTLLAVFAAGLVASALWIDTISRRQAKAQTLSEAALMMTAVNATIEYNDKEVTPLLAGQMKTQFLPQGIPFYAAEQDFKILSRNLPGYTYRQPALDPTNVADRPENWERTAIERFRRDPKLTSLVVDRATDQGPITSYLQPVRITNPSCLECHSVPEVAPSSMIDVYGSKNGFGWKLGDTVGAQIVSLPTNVAWNLARSNRYSLMATLLVVFGLMTVLMNLLLHYVIIRPLRRISNHADEVSLGDMNAPELKVRSRDEIGLLAVSFNRMRRSLAATMSMLED